jgi:S1-C subfamily serine protease
MIDDLVIVLLRDRPEECLGRLVKIDRQLGASADTLRMRWKCFERAFEKGEWKHGEPAEYASAMRDDYVRWIEAAAADPDDLEAIGPDVAGVVSTLTRAGQLGPATAIGGAFRQAAGASPPAIADAPPPSGATSPPVPSAPPPPLPGRGSIFNGSCFFVTPDGVVATNAHVIKGKSNVRVIDSAGKVWASKGERLDPANDLALLRVETAGHAYLSLAPKDAVTIGQPVFTMGYPATQILGHEPKFTDGVISSLTGLENAANLMQISVPIQPGNSGGPVVNDRGQVVGIATSTAAVEVFLRATGSLPQNVNWAVKAEYLARLVDDPPAEQSAPGRSEAIRLTSEAVCRVEAR